MRFPVYGGSAPPAGPVPQVGLAPTGELLWGLSLCVQCVFLGTGTAAEEV